MAPYRKTPLASGLQALLEKGEITRSEEVVAQAIIFKVTRNVTVAGRGVLTNIRMDSQMAEQKVAPSKGERPSYCRQLLPFRVTPV